MSKAFAIASKLDRLGLRGTVARIANLAYPRQRFSVTPQGDWMNSQSACTIVSPSIHTVRYEDMKAWVLDTWCVNYVPGPGDTVIDVGAGVGEESIVFSELVGPAGRVVALEANPDTFRCLDQTIARSGAANVVARNYAVADRNGELAISTGANHLANSVLAPGEGRSVPARSLDAVAEELGIGEVAFLKMNIEGAEKLAVRGMTSLAARVRNLCISCHDFVADAGGDESFRSRELVRAFLVAQGFRVTTRDWTPDRPWHRDYLFGTRES